MGLLVVCSPSAQHQDTFAFTEVDLRFLEQVDAADARYEREGLVYRDPAVETMLDRLTRSMLRDDPSPDRVAWRFKILRSPVVNAFAMPNGSIYVHTGLIASLDNEAQLAGILAHELSHVTRRHSFSTLRSVRKKMVAINIINTAVMYGGLAAPYTGSWRVVLDVLSNVPVILVASIYGYSRELERDADLQGVTMLARGGRDARALMDALRAMRRSGDLEGFVEPVFWATHPRIEERLSYLTPIARPQSPDEAGRPVDPAYLATVAGLVRHNAQLAIDAGRPRGAVADMEQLVRVLPEASDNLYVLAEAYRALGPRAPRALPSERTEAGRRKAADAEARRTPEEREQSLMATREGRAAFAENRPRAEALYRRALAADPSNHQVYRGLGLLYERAGERDAALQAFREYVRAVPDGPDRARIVRRIEHLERRGTQ
jgi:predicted Zn-dependent protease